ncbi:hypothetical protein DSO57_1025200 [Entomophthora muscae]|uniref:Uncharacterized protein n=1 Tax=Entomophthora muscae TaxID=34485 RepID=A0ACC2RH10_9FUNG|nr:hypothetical protein DSO57_1025200 [Entomophthora muscae]
MFISYYKLSIDFDDFGKQGRPTTQKGRNKVKKGTFIGAFLAVSAKGFVYYQKNTDFTNSYKYSHILSGFLDSWDGSNSKHWVFLSHQMEGSSTALKAIQERGHRPMCTQLVTMISICLMLCSLILEIHSRSAALRLSTTSILGSLTTILSLVTNWWLTCLPKWFHANMGNQSQKDKRLPPHATAIYQPIQPMTDEETARDPVLSGRPIVFSGNLGWVFAGNAHHKRGANFKR